MADAASLAFQNTWAMDAASNLSKTMDRSRPVPRVCRRTGPGLHSTHTTSATACAGPGPQHLACCRWCRPNTRLHVHAWLGITNLRASLIGSSLHLHHETGTACPACPHGLHRQAAPAQLFTGPCLSIPGLNLDRTRFQSCIPGQNPPLLQSSQRLSCLHWSRHFDEARPPAQTIRHHQVTWRTRACSPISLVTNRTSATIAAARGSPWAAQRPQG